MIADIVPTTVTGLGIVLLAIVPGYLIVAIWGRRQTWKGRTSDLTTVVESIAFSVVIQVLAIPFTLRLIYPYRNHLDAREGNVAAWLAIVVIAYPILLGTVWAWLSSLVDVISLWLQGKTGRFWRGLRHSVAFVFLPSVPPTTWDLVFKSKIPDGAFVVVTFDNGHQVAGTFNRTATRQAQALTSPQPQGLYLADEYVLDSNGNIFALVPKSEGVMIPSAAHIESVRFIGSSATDGSDTGQQDNQSSSFGSTADRGGGGDQGSSVSDEHGTSGHPAADSNTTTQPAFHGQPDTGKRQGQLIRSSGGALLSVLALVISILTAWRFSLHEDADEKK